MKRIQIVVGAAQIKFQPDIGGNVAWISRQIGTAAEQAMDILLFPECAVTGYNGDFDGISEAEVESALGEIKRIIRRSKVNVLLGCPSWDAGRKFNSLLVFNRQGREIFRYSKIHLTPRDQRYFTPGNAVAYFQLDGIPCTAIICHERRYPELVRLPVMLGAQILFHANAGLDSWRVSRGKRGGRDGIAVRAFENEIYYIFANSVGAQGNGLWSAGDSKIVAPDSRVLALANNRDPMLIHAKLDLTLAQRGYARQALERPAFLQKHWVRMLEACRRQLRAGLR
jgi:predicted amidohydrolase